MMLDKQRVLRVEYDVDATISEQSEAVKYQMISKKAAVLVFRGILVAQVSSRSWQE